jgi:glycerate dehydrogenase
VQHTWALLLALANNIPRDDRLVASGDWSSGTPLNTLLTGKTLAILGLGQLGSEVARMGVAFGMKVVAWSTNLTQASADAAAASHGFAAGTYSVVSRNQLFADADVLSVHLILSSRSRGLVTRADLGRMKPTALLINTARGPLIDEEALLDVLQGGAIRGAALDVFDIEPLPRDSRWRTTEWGADGCAQVILTPHTGYAFDDMLRFMWARTADNVGRIIGGHEPMWRLDTK